MGLSAGLAMGECCVVTELKCLSALLGVGMEIEPAEPVCCVSVYMMIIIPQAEAGRALPEHKQTLTQRYE